MTTVVTPDGSPDAALTLARTFEKVRQLQADTEYALTLKADLQETPVGTVFLAGDDERLHVLGFFTEETAMVRKLALLQKKLQARIEPGSAATLVQAKRELAEYFAGERREFETPLALNGSAFQLRVWDALREIPFGETLPYAELAARIGSPSSFRAVAQACSQNPVTIIVPCHRVVNTGGALGGYAGGADRKRQLLDFEQKEVANSR